MYVLPYIKLSVDAALMPECEVGSEAIHLLVAIQIVFII